MRTGGQMVVEALVENGIDRVFCVPGESYLAVLDALYDVSNRIHVTVCRQEGGAAPACVLGRVGPGVDDRPGLEQPQPVSGGERLHPPHGDGRPHH